MCIYIIIYVCVILYVYFIAYIKMYMSGFWWAPVFKHGTVPRADLAAQCATQEPLCRDLVQKARPAKCEAAATLVPDDGFL